MPDEVEVLTSIDESLKRLAEREEAGEDVSAERTRLLKTIRRPSRYVTEGADPSLTTPSRVSGVIAKVSGDMTMGHVRGALTFRLSTDTGVVRSSVAAFGRGFPRAAPVTRSSSDLLAGERISASVERRGRTALERCTGGGEGISPSASNDRRVVRVGSPRRLIAPTVMSAAANRAATIVHCFEMEPRSRSRHVRRGVTATPRSSPGGRTRRISDAMSRAFCGSSVSKPHASTSWSGIATRTKLSNSCARV